MSRPVTFRAGLDLRLQMPYRSFPIAAGSVMLLAFSLAGPLSAQPGPGGRGPGPQAGHGPGPQVGHGSGPMMMHGRMMGQLPQNMAAPGVAVEPAVAEARAALGRTLFHDPRLSKGGDVSCNSCHDLANYGVDGKRVSTGFRGQTGSRNSPTVYNAASHLAQFWDGRAADVEEQAKGPVLNPVEMALDSEAEVHRILRGIAGYRPLFERAFPGEKEPVTFDNMARAIGAFERTLVTPSRWDRFLAGDRGALSDEEFNGHHEFMHGGCATCHNGPYIGGRMFQKLGAERPWPVQSDPGRMAVTKLAADRMVFKVPSLRNVDRTAPYFHDGSAARLEDAIRMMGRHQLDTELNDVQVRQIAAWLKSLTGEIPQDRIRPPQLPR